MPENITMTTEDIDKEGEEKEADSETAKQPPAKETEDQEKTGDVEKTQETQGDEDSEETELLNTEQPIPFKRFKEFVDKRNTKVNTLLTELEGIKSLFDDPIIFKAILQSKGITDSKIIDEKMKEAGFDVEEEKDLPEDELFKELSKGLDLSKQDGWFKLFGRMYKHFSEKDLKPIQKKLTDKEVNEWISSQEKEAQELAESFDIPYGQSGKDEGNIKTAVGIMAKYLEGHPEDAGLGHVKILRLALSEKGFKLGKEQGKKEEKSRNEALRRSAMEDDTQIMKEGTPNKDWSVSEIMAYREKYAKE